MPKLTDTTIRNARPGERPRKLSDGKGGRSDVVTTATTTRARLLAPLLATLLAEARTPAGAREMEAAE